MALTTAERRGALRAVMRAPLLLYRLDLGWILGRRFLYLATRGRRTGLRRETVLEVVGLDRATSTVYVVSGWGRASDWYRNLEAGPALEVRLGRRRLRAPEHRFLTLQQARVLLSRYRSAHPVVWRLLAPRLGLPGDPMAVQQVYAVAFRPT
ncbi:nitroreductase family deazaflavin-dependent oxidoreductase [Nonomuraea sp. B12E4]|uniref:nitroreductase family deazaflavin-dependent oxidoreductase n=1 Tax=Nonomuraea sp. B12E4 TaxID=3153564 RepID=UPI00325C3C18